jgi:hypothetical protein
MRETPLERRRDRTGLAFYDNGRKNYDHRRKRQLQ